MPGARRASCTCAWPRSSAPATGAPAGRGRPAPARRRPARGARADRRPGSWPPPARRARRPGATPMPRRTTRRRSRRGRAAPRRGAASSCSRWATRSTARGSAPSARGVPEAASLATGTTATPDVLARAALGHGGVAMVIAALTRPRWSCWSAHWRRRRPRTARRAPACAPGSRSSPVRRPERADELSEQAIADARDSGASDALLAALNARRVAAGGPAPHRRALRLAARW